MLKINDKANVMICGMGSYLPEKILTNDDISEMMDTSDEWIRSRTGVGQRHQASKEETTASMGGIAAKRAIKTSGLEPDDIDMVIFGTMFPEYTYPGPGMVVQRLIGCKRSIPVFDIRVQCAGFIYALSMADLYITSGQARHVLCVFAEKEFDHFTIDRQIGVIFSDGAAAAVIGPSTDDRGVLITDIEADGDGVSDLVMTSDNMNDLWKGSEKCHWPPELIKLKKYWDEIGFVDGYTKFPFWIGKEVFKNAVKHLKTSIRGVLKSAELEIDNIDMFFFHQANERINNKIVEMMKLPIHKVPSNIEMVGNTGAASIMILMEEEFKAGHIKKGDMCILSAFGAGYIWGSALVRF